MSTEAIFVIIGTVVTLLGSVAGLTWWAYRRGETAGEEKAGRAEDKARIASIERQIKQLAAAQQRRRRA
jgi:hypothetical protein